MSRRFSIQFPDSLCLFIQIDRAYTWQNILETNYLRGGNVYFANVGDLQSEHCVEGSRKILIFNICYRGYQLSMQILDLLNCNCDINLVLFSANRLIYFTVYFQIDCLSVCLLLFCFLLPRMEERIKRK